ncbi:carbohydrate-binding module family 63 [Hyaloscypha variabilis]
MRFSSAIVASASLALANGAVLGKRALDGQATFYGGNVAGGACSFSTYTLPSSIFGTALSDSNWDDAAECGACISVTGPDGNPITAMIVDECPGCGTNHLDLFPNAFSALANPTLGVIDVAWSYIDCPITSPLQVHNKEGVSAYWFSLQVVNANKRVASLEVSTDGGSTWQSTTRQTYNFFENSSGFGTTVVDVKVTSIDGDVVIVENVDVTPDLVVTASANFGSSGSTAPSANPVVASSSSAAPVVVPSSTVEAVVGTPTPTPTTAAGADFVEYPTQAATYPAAVVPTTSSSTITPAPVPTSTSAPEIVYVTIEACPA